MLLAFAFPEGGLILTHTALTNVVLEWRGSRPFATGGTDKRTSAPLTEGDVFAVALGYRGERRPVETQRTEDGRKHAVL